MSAAPRSRVMVKLPVPKLWQALRRARRARLRRSRLRDLARGAALLLALGVQAVFVYLLMQPTPPLPPREEELELVLDEILAAVQDDGGIAIPLPRLGGQPREVARAPLARPRLAMPAPAAPRLAEAPPLRALSPTAAARSVPQAAVAPAAPTLEAPTPPQLALPTPEVPPLPTPRVLEVDRTPLREWGQAPLVVTTPPPPITPPAELTPPPELARRVLAPDRPTPVAAMPAAPELEVEPTLAPPTAPPLLAQPRPAEVSTEPVPRMLPEPLAVPVDVSPPSAVEVDLTQAPPTRVLQAPIPDAVPLPELAEPVAALPPVQVQAPRVDLSEAPPSRVLEARAQREVPVPQTLDAPALTAAPPPQPVLQVPAANTRLLEPQPQRREVPTLSSEALAAPSAPRALELPAVQVDAPVQATPEERRALSPQRVDPRSLAQVPASAAPSDRPRSAPAPSALALDADALAAAQAGPTESAAPDPGPGTAVRPDVGLPAARSGPPGVASEFDAPVPGSGPARSAADLLAGVGEVARDQVEAGARAPAGPRESFLNRRYDPFYEDLPNRLADFQTREPNAVRQVLGFLLKSLQGGGVTWRGGTRFEAGAELLSRPLVDEADIEAAMGILINRWLEMHEGDVQRACADGYADMTPAVRELLCGPLEAAATPALAPPDG